MYVCGFDVSTSISVTFFIFLGYEVNECDVMSYCMYPDVFLEYAQFREEFGPVQGLPTRLFFVGSDMGEEFEVEIETGKTLHLKIIAVGEVNKEGKREVFCEVNGQLRAFHVDDKNEVKVSQNVATGLIYIGSFQPNIY